MTDHQNPEPKPVTNEENRSVAGMALSDYRGHQESIARIDQLRARQASYLASLPTSAEDAVSAALKIVNPNGDSYPHWFEGARHLSQALRAFIAEGELDNNAPPREAALWIADRVEAAFREGVADMDHLSKVLDNYRRLERERRLGPRPQDA